MSKEKNKSDHIVFENKKYEIISRLRKESQLKQQENDISDIDKFLFKKDDMLGSLMNQEEKILKTEKKFNLIK